MDLVSDEFACARVFVLPPFLHTSLVCVFVCLYACIEGDYRKMFVIVMWCWWHVSSLLSVELSRGQFLCLRLLFPSFVSMVSSPPPPLHNMQIEWGSLLANTYIWRLYVYFNCMYLCLNCQSALHYWEGSSLSSSVIVPVILVNLLVCMWDIYIYTCVYIYIVICEHMYTYICIKSIFTNACLCTI